MQYKRIFIIGHPGSGKALLAKTLAEHLGWRFINADFGLEFHIGRHLTDIIGKEGNNNFHQVQTEIFSSLIKEENIVVNTDASTVCSSNICNLLYSEFVVYLKVDKAIQLERLLRNPTPLLLSDADIETFLNKLHEKRDNLYDKNCKLTIDGNNNDLNNHVEIILEAIGADINTSSEITLDNKDLIIFHKTLHTPVHLTDQQAACLKLLSQGKTSKEIARELNISYRTVEGYLAKIMESLDCSSSKEMIALYLSK